MLEIKQNLNKILIKSPTVRTKIPKNGPNLTDLFATMAYTLGFSKKKKKKANLGQILTIHSTVGSFPAKMLENLSFF